MKKTGLPLGKPVFLWSLGRNQRDFGPILQKNEALSALSGTLSADADVLSATSIEISATFRLYRQLPRGYQQLPNTYQQLLLYASFSNLPQPVITTYRNRHIHSIILKTYSKIVLISQKSNNIAIFLKKSLLFNFSEYRI
ncbi:hypothetical protein JOC78_001707 [Bacillus ectoiniformans]|nr:hypothetical protein [Bacillus ectoiniformans]